MSAAKPELFKSTVLGIGPWCVEFPDGEIIHTRSEERQRLIAAAPDLLQAAQRLLAAMDDYDGGMPTSPGSPYAQMRDAIAEATGVQP